MRRDLSTGVVAGDEDDGDGRLGRVSLGHVRAREDRKRVEDVASEGPDYLLEHLLVLSHQQAGGVAVEVLGLRS